MRTTRGGTTKGSMKGSMEGSMEGGHSRVSTPAGRGNTHKWMYDSVHATQQVRHSKCDTMHTMWTATRPTQEECALHGVAQVRLGVEPRGDIQVSHAPVVRRQSQACVPNRHHPSGTGANTQTQSKPMCTRWGMCKASAHRDTLEVLVWCTSCEACCASSLHMAAGWRICTRWSMHVTHTNVMVSCS